MKILFLFAIVSAFAFSTFAQDTDLSALSKTANGQKVLDYLSAFNSGDEQKLKSFLLENLSADALRQRPVEARLDFQRQIKSDFQSLEITKILSTNEIEIRVLARGKSGDSAELLFEFEKTAPNKMLGVRVMRMRLPENDDENRQANAPESKAEFLSMIEKYVAEQVSADKFSGVVLIAENDKPIFEKAYGLADKENKTPNNLETKFNLGSINKTFTRIAVGQLVKAGKVSFDDKLGKFLPDYPNKDAREKVTIRHLVTMKSGIGEFFGDKFMAMPKDKLRKNSDFIPLFADKPLAFEPGMREQYSNGGYILLGAIIEKVTGKSYYDYVRENIFKIAGMKNTDSFEADKLPANTAKGYTKQNPKNEWIGNVDFQAFRGSAAGGGYSNVQDLLKFSTALKSGKLSIPDDDGNPRKDMNLGIAGGSVGINAILTIDSRKDFTIIVLSNYDPPSAEKIGSQIRDWTAQIK